MARTNKRKTANASNPRRYIARFQRDRPIDLGLLSKAFVELAQAMAEHDAQESNATKKESSHEKRA